MSSFDETKISIRICRNLLEEFQIYCQKQHADVSNLVREFMQSSIDKNATPHELHLKKVRGIFQKIEAKKNVTGFEIAEISEILGVKPETLKRMIKP